MKPVIILWVFKGSKKPSSFLENKFLQNGRDGDYKIETFVLILFVLFDNFTYGRNTYSVGEEGN